MKKIISIFAVLIVSLTAFCLPAFALEPTEKTFDTFNQDGNGLFNTGSPEFIGVSVDYQRDPLSRYPWIFQYETTNGSATFGSVEFRFFTDDDIVSTDYGDILQFTMKDITTFDLYDMSKNAYVKCNYRVKRKTGWEKWQSWNDFEWYRDGSGEFHVDFNFYYKNNGTKLTDIEFEIAFHSYTRIEFRYPGFEFPQYAINVYNGPSSDPSAPNYSPPNELKDKTDTLKENEQILNESTEEGRESTINLFNGLATLITEFAIPLQCISAIFNYFVGTSILNSVLQISLSIGLLAFVFNIGSSLVSRANNNKNKGNRKGGG